MRKEDFYLLDNTSQMFVFQKHFDRCKWKTWEKTNTSPITELTIETWLLILEKSLSLGSDCKTEHCNLIDHWGMVFMHDTMILFMLVVHGCTWLYLALVLHWNTEVRLGLCPKPVNLASGALVTGTRAAGGGGWAKGNGEATTENNTGW